MVRRRAVGHGDAVAVQQIRQPLLSGSTPRVSLKHTESSTSLQTLTWWECQSKVQILRGVHLP